jgi:hypothetical protein
MRTVSRGLPLLAVRFSILSGLIRGTVVDLSVMLTGVLGYSTSDSNHCWTSHRRSPISGVETASAVGGPRLSIGKAAKYKIVTVGSKEHLSNQQPLMNRG